MTIDLSKLTTRFGDLTAVDAIDLDVGDGEVLCLLGPSGCGKTTTLRMIAGHESISEGRVLIDDLDVSQLPPARRGTAMMCMHRVGNFDAARASTHHASTRSRAVGLFRVRANTPARRIRSLVAADSCAYFESAAPSARNNFAPSP